MPKTFTIQEVQAILDAERKAGMPDPDAPIELTHEENRADAVARVIVSALSNTTARNKYLNQLEIGITPKTPLNLQNPSPDSYKSIRATSLPPPPTAEISAAASLFGELKAKIHRYLQSWGVNLGRTVDQIPVIYGIAPLDDADNIILNNSLWLDAAGSILSHLHGSIVHLLQLYLIMKMIESGEVDTSGLKPYYDLTKPFYLLSAIISSVAHFNFSSSRTRQALWDLVMDHEPLLYNGDATLFHTYSGPFTIVEDLLSPANFTDRPHLAHAMYYSHCRFLFALSELMKISVHEVYVQIIAHRDDPLTDSSALLNAIEQYKLNSLTEGGESQFATMSKCMCLVQNGYFIQWGKPPITDPKQLSHFARIEGFNALNDGENEMSIRFFIQADELLAKADSKINAAPTPKPPASSTLGY